jgi:hypothetical protein
MATGTVSVVVVGSTVARPTLSIQLGTGTATIQWTTNFTGYVAQATGTVADTNSWATLTNVPTFVGTNFALTFPITNAQQFFRLRSP